MVENYNLAYNECWKNKIGCDLMKLLKAVFILIFSITLCGKLYANISVSNKSIFEYRENEHIGATNFITNTMLTNYVLDKNANTIIIEGNDIRSKNTTASNVETFEYIPPISGEKTHPFRFTEVSFFIAFPFIYTYSLLAVSGFNALEDITPADVSRSAYKQLQTSELLFTFVGATFAAAAVGYANYSRVYGKRSKENNFNASFTPTIETIDNKTSTGFIFTLSYPY